MKNYYAILEAPVGCSLEEIRQSYHRLVQEHLDDEFIFADLKEAYEVLTTPSRRDEYDRTAWGETFDPSSPSAPEAGGMASSGGPCPMGAEAQCPVLLGRADIADKYCPECGFLLAALRGGVVFERETPPNPLRQVWLEERSGQTHALKPGVNFVGRESADVLLPDKTVSRQHARLTLGENGNLTVEDLSSTNGTQVNDVLLPTQSPRNLANGDRVRFGSVFLILHLPADEPAPATSTALPVSSPVEAAPAPTARITEMRDGGGRVFPLEPGITTFGRRAENAVVLTGDLYVSGIHAQIVADNGVYILTDLGSTNGTLLNGERLTINTPYSLDNGDVILIGGSAFRFARLGPDGEEIEEIEPEETEEESEDEATAENVPGQVEG